MEDLVKVESALEENVSTFIQHLKTDAVAYQAFGRQLRNLDRPAGGSKATGVRNIPIHANKGIKELSLQSVSNRAQPAGMPLPICLHPLHREKRACPYIKDCKD